MNKELTPLEALKRLKDLEDLQGGRDEFFEYVKVIEKALEENTILHYWLEGVKYYFEDSSFTLLSLSKDIKALEIIKKKQIVIKTIERCNNFEEYNEYVFINNLEHDFLPELTQEEFDLLKEVLFK